MVNDTPINMINAQRQQMGATQRQQVNTYERGGIDEVMRQGLMKEVDRTKMDPMIFRPTTNPPQRIPGGIYYPPIDRPLKYIGKKELKHMHHRFRKDDWVDKPVVWDTRQLEE